MSLPSMETYRQALQQAQAEEGILPTTREDVQRWLASGALEAMLDNPPPFDEAQADRILDRTFALVRDWTGDVSAPDSGD